MRPRGGQAHPDPTRLRVCLSLFALACWLLLGAPATHAWDTEGRAPAAASDEPTPTASIAPGLTDTCPTCGHRTLRVRLLDRVGLPQDSTSELSAQIAAIWASRGVVVDSGRRDPDPRPSGAAVYIVLAHGTPADCAAASSRPCRIHMTGAGADDPIGLAWIPFEGPQPGSVIFVSVDRVRQLLSTSDFEGRRLERCPVALARVLLGRALGRVSAHEIGHYLDGPAHSRTGLMKAMLSPDDLLLATMPSWPN
jgi:hypothetical protein